MTVALDQQAGFTKHPFSAGRHTLGFAALLGFYSGGQRSKETTMPERVIVERENHIAQVRMNRPEKLNALDMDMIQGLAEAGRDLVEDRSVRAVVLSGEGRAFCAGLDFTSFMAPPEPGEPAFMDLIFSRRPDCPANLAQECAYIWQMVPAPVIAAVQGMAFGGGLQIAMGADMRYVTPDCCFSIMEIKYGLVPDMSGTQTLRNLLPLDVLKELTFTGRIVEGTEARELGLATHVTDQPFEKAMETAALIATKSPDAVRADKKLLNQAVLGTIDEGLLLEENIQKTLIGRSNQLEALLSVMEKRDPDFGEPEE